MAFEHIGDIAKRVVNKQKYYVHHNGHSWFVKEAAFFEEQGGLTTDWGKAWSPLYANSVEEARTKAEKELS